MSDVSVLSHEYQTVSDLAQELNASLVALKKAVLATEGAETMESAILEKDRLRLAEIGASLAQILDPNADESQSETAARVPGALIARVRDERGGDLDYFLEDLRAISTRLRHCPEQVTQEDLAFLDQIAASAEAETTRVFRRLMRM
jgi:hypothetical protein